MKREVCVLELQKGIRKYRRVGVRKDDIEVKVRDFLLARMLKYVIDIKLVMAGDENISASAEN